MIRYLVLMERTDRNYGAYAPDLPGCVATGRTPEEALQRMVGAMEMHVRGMEADGVPLPEPATTASYVSVAV